MASPSPLQVIDRARNASRNASDAAEEQIAAAGRGRVTGAFNGEKETPWLGYFPFELVRRDISGKQEGCVQRAGWDGLGPLKEFLSLEMS